MQGGRGGRSQQLATSAVRPGCAPQGDPYAGPSLWVGARRYVRVGCLLLAGDGLPLFLQAGCGGCDSQSLSGMNAGRERGEQPTVWPL